MFPSHQCNINEPGFEDMGYSKDHQTGHLPRLRAFIFYLMENLWFIQALFGWQNLWSDSFAQDYLRHCWLHKMYLFLGRAQTGYFLKWAQSVTYTWATKVQVSLCKCPISSGPSLLAHTKYGLRGSTRLLEILVQWMAGQADLNGQIWNIDSFHVTWTQMATYYFPVSVFWPADLVTKTTTELV